MKQTFTRSPEALVALGVTHILLRYDADGALLGLLRRFPGVPERLTPVATLELRGRPVQLIPIDPPLALPGAEPAPKRPHILSPKRLLGPDVVDPAAP